MTIDKQALRKAAEKATPGPWEMEQENIWFTDAGGYTKHLMYAQQGDDVDDKQDHYNTAFIAAANPATVLMLLDELEAAEKRIAELESKNGNLRTIAHDQNELAIKANLDSINDAVEMDRLHKRITELERSETQLISERDDAESALNDVYKAVMGQAPEWSNWFSFENAIDEIELACELWRNQTDDVIQFRQRIQELEAKLETADKLQDGAFRDGLKAGFSYGQTDDQSGFMQCMSAYSTRAGIGVKQQQDSVDSDVGSRNQPGMVVAVHIGAGDFVKVKGQVFEVEETDFDDHDVTLWFVGGNVLKCAAGCQVEVVSAPVAAGIKVEGE
ncbi:ead/Ea22-like family protein [Salmonella enterica subsp. enterica]|nr:ead/Ea22-like family protein [Salmonella enterica subsp. enterica]EDY2803212.1 ead/Ea22-like family protein [Salmonella enterica subsp. enterica]